MKLGIITFHRAKNYGAVLQTYALNKATRNLGIESEVIDYRYNKIENDYVLFKNKSLKGIIKDLVNYPIKKIKNKKFESFLESNINLSKEIYNSSDLQKTNQIYDCFLTGSDQVFNLRMTGEDENYFLKFVKENKKRNSYAASFGQKQLPEEKSKQYKNLIEKFNNLSLREKDGIELVKKVTDRKARIDVDPTFLLTKEQWNEISKKPQEENKYILLFVMQKNKSIFEFAEKLSKETGLEIIFITDGLKKLLKAKHKKVVSPIEWLGYFYNAEYIITNSFHGLAFSIIFNKEFFLELQRPPATGNSRLENVLNEYELKDRLIIEGENENIKEMINWEKINETILKNRENSLEYLKGLINE